MQPQPEILDDVGVLIFVDQDVAKTVLIFLQHVGVLAKQPEGFQQQVAEIDGVERLQPLLIGACRAWPRRRWRRPRGLARADVARGQPRFFQSSISPASARAGQRFSSIFSALRSLLEQPQLIVGVENGEIGFQTHQLGVPAQHLAPIEWKVPIQGSPSGSPVSASMRSRISRAALLVKVTASNLVAPRASGREEMRDAGGQHAGLADARPRQHQHRTVERLDGAALFGIERIEIGGGARRTRALGDRTLWEGSADMAPTCARCA